ncbi:hypothetical protein NIES25_03250 [Nostoc linckia NIES-25]|nr:hypothetical protein NIES25_03250 [Nostoc linckia NIES-25]
MKVIKFLLVLVICLTAFVVPAQAMIVFTEAANCRFSFILDGWGPDASGPDIADCANYTTYYFGPATAYQARANLVDPPFDCSSDSPVCQSYQLHFPWPMPGLPSYEACERIGATAHTPGCQISLAQNRWK